MKKLSHTCTCVHSPPNSSPLQAVRQLLLIPQFYYNCFYFIQCVCVCVSVCVCVCVVVIITHIQFGDLHFNFMLFHIYFSILLNNLHICHFKCLRNIPLSYNNFSIILSLRLFTNFCYYIWYSSEYCCIVTSLF